MKQQLTLSAVALAAAGLLAGAAHAEGPEFSFNGFGTVGLVHSSNNEADFVNESSQNNGAGLKRSTSLGVDTNLGLQVNAKFSPEWSGVVQLISKQRYDSSWTPTLEWANVAWQVTPEVRLRAGRTALPAYAISESRYVGYSQHWARAPIEVYGVQSITSNDGLDVTWRKAFGTVNNTLQAYAGTSEQKTPGGSAKSKLSWGLANTAEMGDLTLRASYGSMDVDAKVPAAATYMGWLKSGIGIGGLGGGRPTSPIPARPDLAEKYKLNDLSLSMLSLGAAYDPGQWFATSEAVFFSGDGLLSDSTSFVVSGGMRFGKFTPYATYARTQAKWKFESGAPTDVIVGATNTFIKRFTGRQQNVAVGLRWDAMKNFAVKGQIERISLRDGSIGRFANAPQRGIAGGTTLISLQGDFVF